MGPLRESERRSPEPGGTAPSPYPLPASGAREPGTDARKKFWMTVQTSPLPPPRPLRGGEKSAYAAPPVPRGGGAAGRLSGGGAATLGAPGIASGSAAGDIAPASG